MNKEIENNLFHNKDNSTVTENPLILNLEKKITPLIRNVLGVFLFLISGLIFFVTTMIVQSSTVERISSNELFWLRTTNYISYIIALIGFLMCRSPRKVKASEVSETFSIPLYLSTFYGLNKKFLNGITNVKFSPSHIEIDLYSIGIEKIEKIYWNKIISTSWFTNKIYSIKTESSVFFISTKKPNISDNNKKYYPDSITKDEKEPYLWALHQYARYYADKTATKWRNNDSAVFFNTAMGISTWGLLLFWTIGIYEYYKAENFIIETLIKIAPLILLSIIIYVIFIKFIKWYSLYQKMAK